jgi:LPXTG-site transpeptidase (sortase) family protein
MARKILIFILNIIIGLGILGLLVLPLALILPGVPEIWYQIDSTAVDKEVTSLVADLGARPIDLASNKQYVAVKRPAFDASLPKQNRVRIPSIGVDGLVHEGANGMQVLAKGIWRSYDFGTPESDTLPTIFASHRYGNPRWSKDFRDKEIFFNLDKVKVGDTVEVVWNQRLYKYEVVKVETSRQVNSLDFQVMIYTCNYWNSPDRIFVYLKQL